MNETKKSGLAVAALVLGIVGIALSFIPIINNAAFVFAVIGLILGIIALAKKNKKGPAIAGVILCVLAIIITLVMQQAAAKALNEASSNLEKIGNDMSGDNTAEILGKDVSVDLGQFVVTPGQYSTTTELPVTITNLTSEQKTFVIQIEAVSADGTRITDDTVYANNLGASQKQDFKAFQYITDDKLEAIKTATFKVASVSMM